MFLDNATRIEGKKTKILLDPYELKMFKGESYEGVLGVQVTRPRAWRHGQGHSQRNMIKRLDGFHYYNINLVANAVKNDWK